MKRHIQYLSHLISPEGIQPLQEKLESIQNMPVPRSTKEVQQFLGLTGYYHKFVPRFSDISRPLTRLTHKDVMFEWTKECQAIFLMLKEALCQQPILKYPDTSKLYILFTDASKHGWAGVFTQPYQEIDESNLSTAKKWPTKIIHYPATYVSGHFRRSQLNWAALTKEAYAIYILVRTLTNADVLIRCDHLPLKKFLSKNTMNAKVNN